MTEVLLISGHRPGLRGIAGLAEHLATAGVTVRIAFAASGDDARRHDLSLRGVAEARRLRMSLSGRRNGAKLRRLSREWGRVVARNAVVRAWVRVAGPVRRTSLLAKYDPWLRRVVRNADVIIAAHDALPAARRAALRNPRAVVFPVGDPRIEDVLARARAALPLQRVLRRLDDVDVDEVLAAWRKAVAAPDDPYLGGYVPKALALSQGLRRRRAFDAAATIARAALDLDPPAETRARLQLELAAVAIGATGVLPDALPDAVRGVLAYADEAVHAGRMDEAAPLVLDVADAMFHRELHADVLATPLVADPAAFLAPLRESLTQQVLTAPAGSMASHLDSGIAPTTPLGGDGTRPATDRPRPSDDGLARRHGADTGPGRPRTSDDGTSRPHRLLVVPGDYPHFTRGIISALRADAAIDLRVLDLREPGVRGRRTARPAMVTDRLYAAAGLPVPPLPAADAELLAWADTIFVDWCDNAAQWATLHAPPRARIVIRFHSLEAISPQPHLIDWTRVSDVIFVGEHVRQLVERAVPSFAAVSRVHVVPNEMRLERFGLPKRPGAERTLAMVGWAQRVKDPLWALDVLARLRAHDEAWRLLLIGHDFSDHQHRGALAYADGFRARAGASDVRDGLTYVGYTSDLPGTLCDAGFIVSASRREGFPVGPTEGVASGAVPIIRDWPMYAGYDGARGIFPADWVVDTPDEAAERILAHAEPSRRAAAGAAAREFVVERFDWSVVEPRFRAVLLGGVEHERSSGPVLDDVAP